MKNFSKKTMIGGILALSLVLAGTGYAYWTDGLSVTTKATTGELDVTFVDLGLYAQYGSDTNLSDPAWSIYDDVDGTDGNGYVDKSFFADNNLGTERFNQIAKEGSIEDYADRTKGFNKVTFGADYVSPEWIKVTYSDSYNPWNALGSDKIELSVNQIYPGYAQLFRSDIINNGSIAAKLSQLSFAVAGTPNDQTKDMIGIALKLDRDDGSGVVYDLTQNTFTAAQKFTVGSVEFVRLSALDGETFDTITNAILQTSDVPMGRMDIFVGVAMDPDATGQYTTGSTAVNNTENSDAATQNQEAVITIDLGWDQFNAVFSANETPAA